MGGTGWRSQQMVAYAAMSVIPILSFGYFLLSCFVPGTATREGVLTIVILITLLSLAGFIALHNMLKKVSGLLGDAEDMVRECSKGRDLPLPGSSSSSASLEMTLEKLRVDKELLETEVARKIKELEEDIEQRTKAEQALRETNMMLSDALCEIKQMERRSSSEERSRVLGQMASSIAHDFNNALMPILGLTELLVTNPKQLDNREELVSTLNDIHTSAERALNVVEKLRDYYRTNSESDLDIIDVDITLDKAVNAYGKKLAGLGEGKRDISIRLELGNVPLVKADELDFREAINKIIENAVEAMPQGGTIVCRTSVHGKYVVIEIVDNGVGMNLEVQGHCFEPFFSTKSDSGLGVGLSVVHGIARKFRGHVDIRSEPGKGTSVQLFIPETFLPADRRDARAGSTDVISARILVVDDDLNSRNLLARYLGTLGYLVETAETGGEGIRVLGAGMFDIVITDRALPDMSGDIVAKSVYESGKKLPVIMLTGFGELMKDKGEKPVGVTIILGKPISLKELKESISEIIAGTMSGLK